MKKLSSKTKLPFLAILFVIAIASSSCNRGVGCPTNFSVPDFTKNVVEQVVVGLIDL
jgi:hypothetical protein